MKYAELYRPKARRSAREKRERLLAKVDGAAETALARDDGVLMLSHGHCLDGVGSVIMALRKYDAPRLGIAYVQPSHMSSVLAHLAEHHGTGGGRTMHIADLSLNPDQYDDIVLACAKLASGGWKIEWRDHHHKQWEDLDLSLLEQHLKVLQVNDDASESGASLMQQALCKRDAFAKRLAETIRDRDLWWNKTPDSEILEFAITWMGTDEFTTHMVRKTGRDKVVDDVVAAAAKEQQRLIEEHTQVLLDDAWYLDAESGGKVGVVYGWLPKNVGLHRMLEQDEVRLAINVRPNGKVSVRSRQDTPVSHLVCRRFDGGGHPNASGADLGLKGLAYRWYLLRHGKVPRSREMAEAAVEEVDAMAKDGA